MSNRKMYAENGHVLLKKKREIVNTSTTIDLNETLKKKEKKIITVVIHLVFSPLLLLKRIKYKIIVRQINQ